MPAQRNASPFIERRNEGIRRDAAAGAPAEWLAATYGLSVSQVNRITSGVERRVGWNHEPTTDWERDLEILGVQPLADPATLRDAEPGSFEPCVYFVQMGTQPYVKIGISSPASLDVRLSILQVGNPIDLHVRRAVVGDRGVELALHARYRDLRVRGEWFLADGELVEVARAVS